MNYDNWKADEYESSSDMQLRHALEAIARSSLSPTDALLDIGCGDGKISRLLAESVPDGKVVGIDLTDGMVAYARKRHGDVPNLSFQQMSADALSFDSEFDYMFSFSCLHWVENQTAVWAGVHRALKPKGKVIIGFQADQESFWPVIEDMVHSAKWSSYFEGFVDPYNHFTRQEMYDFVEKGGFYLNRIDEIYSVEPFHSFASLQAFLENWVPQFRYLEGDQRTRFSTEAIQRFLEIIEPELRSQYAIRMKRYIIEAQRLD